ncbi:single-stranded DNA-binding protein [Chryseobacterium mucoviscidosis]|nr:single-stranded DNA-binding protein [Chryseobacterium mucoviscidosis]
MLNRSILIGRLTRDPELRYTPAGVAVTQFTLAVDRPFSNNGEKEADFIPVVTWRQLAEACANYTRKGRLVAVEGRIQVRNYENNEGKRVYVTEVIADNVRFLEGRSHEKTEDQIEQSKSDTGYSNYPSSDDDLPF